MPLSRDLGALTSWNPLGLSRPVMGLLYGVFPGGKGGRCVRLTTLPQSCAVVTKSGSPNFLEPSGPLQACNWTDFTYCHLHDFRFLPPYEMLTQRFIAVFTQVIMCVYYSPIHAHLSRVISDLQIFYHACCMST